MNERRARERGGHPQSGVRRRVRRCGGRRLERERGKGGDLSLEGGVWGRIGCAMRRRARAVLDLVWTDVAASLAATLIPG